MDDQDKLRIDIFDGSRPDERVIVLEGFLNAETAFRFQEVARQQASASLIVDMSRVRSVDSSGLGVPIGLYVSAEHASRRLLLAGLNDRIWELFRVCKIEDVFTRYSSVAEAEQALPVSPDLASA